ncbi:hypothetical protein FRB95_001551 [Tulasnella sp. JGI-2019a]|nr:hypothetical protein FRB95_001551 [Tulasnella sp. JGI-2019a]
MPVDPSQQQVPNADDTMDDVRADNSSDCEEFSGDELEDSKEDPIAKIQSWASTVVLHSNKESISDIQGLY